MLNTLSIKLFTLILKVCIIIKNFDTQSSKERLIMLEKIKSVLVEAINVDEDAIVPTARLEEDLDIDSLAAVELAMELETAFDIEIADEELAKLKTIQDIMDLIAKKQ